MKIVKATFNGKTYELPANNSGWISTSEQELPEGITADFLKNRDRVGTGPKNEPIIQDDAGHKIHLGSAAFRREDEKICQSGGSSSNMTIKGLNTACQKLADELAKMKDVPQSVTEALAALAVLCRDASALELHEGDDILTILEAHPKLTLTKLKEEAEKVGLVFAGTCLGKKPETK